MGHGQGQQGLLRVFHSLHWTAAAKAPGANELGIATTLWTMAARSRVLFQVFNSLHWADTAKVPDANELGITITRSTMAATGRIVFQVFDSRH